MYRIIFPLALLILISCNQNKSTEKNSFRRTSKSEKKADSLSGIWKLLKVDDTIFDIQKEYGHPAEQPSFKIENSKQRISGFSGCNGYGADAKIDSLSIELTEGILATEMGCGENIWENDFFSRLRDIDSLKYNADTLILYNSEDRSLTFLRRHLHPLEMYTWELYKVNDTLFDIKKAYNSPNEPQPVIKFDFEKNQIGGYDGCNSFGLQINFKEDFYTSGQLMSNARGCYDGWSEKFYGILAENQSISLKMDKLILTNSSGQSMEFKRIE